MTAQVINIRPLQPNDWPFVAEIYLKGIKTGNATFEEKVPAWEVWDDQKKMT